MIACERPISRGGPPAPGSKMKDSPSLPAFAYCYPHFHHHCHRHQSSSSPSPSSLLSSQSLLKLQDQPTLGRLILGTSLWWWWWQYRWRRRCWWWWWWWKCRRRRWWCINDSEDEMGRVTACTGVMCHANQSWFEKNTKLSTFCSC